MSKITVTGQLTLTGGQLTAKETYVAPAGPSVYALWVWGNGNNGELAQGNTTDRNSPVQIGALTDWSSVLDTGSRHTLVIKTDSSLWAWGNNSGRLGDGTAITRSSPVQIGLLTDWSSVSAADRHSVAIKTDGTLWSWGLGSSGRLGHGNTTDLSSPVQVGSLTTWASVEIGPSQTLAIKTDGTLWAWGNNSPNGQLGDGTIIDKSSPVQIGSLTDWASVGSGDRHSHAIKTDGTLWSWGDQDNGKIGDGVLVRRSSPVQIGSLTDWTTVNVGYLHTLALKTAS